MRMIVAVTGIFILTGCVSHKGVLSAQEAYRADVRRELQGMDDQLKEASALLSRWHPPLVQEVTIPAQVSQGVLIPEHKEMVIIKHGEWRVNEAASYQRKNNDEIDTKRINGLSSDLGILPQGMGRL